MKWCQFFIDADDSVSGTFMTFSSVFAALTISNLDDYITKKKIEIRSNPESGEGSLFENNTESDYSEIDNLVSTFCSMLK